MHSMVTSPSYGSIGWTTDEPFQEMIREQCFPSGGGAPFGLFNLTNLLHRQKNYITVKERGKLISINVPFKVLSLSFIKAFVFN